MCWLLSKPFHTWLQTAPVHAEGHTLIKPTEPHHLQKAEMPFGGSQSGHLFHHGYAFKFCPWKSKNRTDDREPCRSPAHIESVCICAEDSDTDITLVYKNLMKTVMSHISLNMVCYNQFTTSTKSNNKTPLWFRSGSQFLTWALKLEPLPRPHLKTQRTAVLFHIRRQQSESYPMWLKLTGSDSLAQHNSDALWGIPTKQVSPYLLGASHCGLLQPFSRNPKSLLCLK